MPGPIFPTSLIDLWKDGNRAVCLNELMRFRDKLQIEYSQEKEIFKREKKANAQIQEEFETYSEALDIAQKVAKKVQQEAHSRISAVVSRCLSTVFDDPYEFQIIFEEKRGKTEARIVFIRDGKELDPLTAAGGGVVDVAAFALRLACLVLARPPHRKLVVLDEPFKFVSLAKIPKVRALLESLSEEMGLQIIMVTHITDLQTGNIVEVV